LSTYPLIIRAVGDICPGDMNILGLGVCSKTKKYGAEYLFDSVRDHLKNADIVFGNLEGILTSQSYSRIMRFCGIPEFASALKNAGFTVISVANNHIFEQGVSGFNDTIDNLKKQNILICGLRGEKEYYSQPVIIDKKGKTIGMLSYNWVGVSKFPDADSYIAQSHDSMVNYTWNRDPAQDIEHQKQSSQRNSHVIEDIRRLKSKVDIVIVFPHWGFEFVHVPPLGVVLEAHSFIDAGADCIIGSHPHVLQGMETYKNKLIFYSLGNFIFDMPFIASKNGVILDCAIHENGPTSHSFHFTRSNHNFQPIPLEATHHETVNRIVTTSSNILKSSNCKTLLHDDLVYKEFEKRYNRQKWITIFRHVTLLPMHPFIIKVISIKIFGFIYLMLLRLQGKKIRW